MPFRRGRAGATGALRHRGDVGEAEAPVLTQLFFIRTRIFNFLIFFAKSKPQICFRKVVGFAGGRVDADSSDGLSTPHPWGGGTPCRHPPLPAQSRAGDRRGGTAQSRTCSWATTAEVLGGGPSVSAGGKCPASAPRAAVKAAVW